MSHPAVFLDRDGTLVHDPGFLRDPTDVRLFDGVPDALAALARAGFRLIVITNQSGIGRGIVTAAAFDAVQQELAHQLSREGVSLDGVFVCPHLPDDGCPCRKPGSALHREAAAIHSLALDATWCVGDRIGDVVPATSLGGQGVLVETGEGARHAEAARKAGFAVARNLGDAARIILAGGPGGPTRG